MNADEREFYKGLRERIKQLRMEHLFEEPCPLYEEEDEEINYIQQTIKNYEGWNDWIRSYGGGYVSPYDQSRNRSSWVS